MDNPGLQHVLEKSGFVATGARDDSEAGALITGASDLTHQKSAV